MLGVELFAGFLAARAAGARPGARGLTAEALGYMAAAPNGFYDRVEQVTGIGAELLAERRVGLTRVAAEWCDGIGRLWQPWDRPDGTPVITVPVGLHDHLGGPASYWDILALDPHDPARWARRTGHAGGLGRWPDDVPDGERGCIRVFEHPLDWLRHEPVRYPLPDTIDRSGVCVLERGCLAPGELIGFDLIADSEAHAARLKIQLKAERAAVATPKAPAILIARGERPPA